MSAQNEKTQNGASSDWQKAGFVLIAVIVLLLAAMCLLWANRKARASAHDIEMGVMCNRLQEAAQTTEEHKSALQAMDAHLHDTLEHVAYRAQMEELTNLKVVELQSKVDSLLAANRALTGQDDFEDGGQAVDSAPADGNSRSFIADIVLAQGPAKSHHGAARSLEEELAAAEFGEYLDDHFVIGDEEEGYASSEDLDADSEIDDANSGVSTLHSDETRIEPDSDAVSVLSKYHRNSVVVEEVRPVTIVHAQAQAIVVSSDR